jgi:glyoxylase-like metal-dependent hydrolase (beta-lactamase superfamily II)
MLGEAAVIERRHPAGGTVVWRGPSKVRSKENLVSGQLTLDVYNSGYKSIASIVPGWPEGKQATWPASTATLISGDTDAVLVDALLTNDEADALVDFIRKSGKNLTTVYVTHGHGDHFFGLPAILRAFPRAKAVALPEVIPGCLGQTTADLMAFWNATFPGQLPAERVIPEALGGNTLLLEDHELRFVNVGQSDTHPSSVVHIPDLDAVVGGDVAYNGIHMWMQQTDHDARIGWLKALDVIEGLAPRVLVAGHKDPSGSDEDVAGTLADSRKYIRDFDEAVASSTTPAEVVEKVMAEHKGRGNEYTLWFGAQAQFPS